jgi:glycosyltransferase involved in cell wall biosynthesis
LRIALVTPYFPPNVGGIETYTYELAKRLSKENEVYVFTCGGGITETYGAVEVLRFRAIDMQNLPFPLKIPYPVPPSLMIKLTKFDADIIHAHGHAFMTTLQAALAARMARKPFVITVHDLGVAYRDYTVMRGIRPIVDKTIVRYVFRKADMVVCQNEATHRYARRYGPRRMVTIPQGVDLDRFRPKKEGKAVTFIAARLVPQKGGEIFVKAVPEVIRETDEARFTVVGDGAQKSHLENLARDLGVADCVEFVGRIPHRKVAELLSKARIVVFPSEIPTGLTMLEAAAMKRAIISARNPWAVSSLGDAPLYVSTSGPEETARAIIWLLNNDDERRRIAERVYERVSPEWNWDTVAQRHLEMYSQLISGR